MRRVSIEKLTPGSKLALPIPGPNGLELLGRGVELSRSYIERLKDMGYTTVIVEDDLLEDVDIEEVITVKTKMQVVDCIRNTTETFKQSKSFNSTLLRKVMDNILDDIISNRSMLVSLNDLKIYDKNDYLFNHSINVTVLSVMIGIILYYPVDKLHDLGMGVLLHDLGKVQIPNEVAYQHSPLKSDETDAYKQHTTLGFEILRSDPQIKITSAHVAYQHHEHFDGTGYPRGLKGEGILEFARICAIADAYDILANGRNEQKGLLPYKACETMQKYSGTLFDPDILERFIQKIAHYPQGIKILLNDGRSGFVIKQNTSDPYRPIVRLFWNDGKEIPPEEIDLLELKSLCIVDVLE